ncbi:hypothetical protein KC980_00570, partial [candidate division WWE3 bacterium]|nr:hypothetical protein [candidate division WWE3 bacterium]
MHLTRRIIIFCTLASFVLFSPFVYVYAEARYLDLSDYLTTSPFVMEVASKVVFYGNGFKKFLPSNQPYTVELVAKGIGISNTSPRMVVFIDDYPLVIYRLSPEFSSYKFLYYDSSFDISRIKVAFLDTDATVSSQARFFTLGKLFVNSVLYNASDYYSYGAWDTNSGCSGGYKNTSTLQCNGYFDFGNKDPNPPETSIASRDERFGASACEISTALELGSGYGWGQGIAYPNEREIAGCAKTHSNTFVLLTVGKLDNTVNLDEDLDALKASYLAPGEVTDYAALEAIIAKYVSQRSLPNNPYFDLDAENALSSYLNIPRIAADAKAAGLMTYWQITNEPDNIFAAYVPPEDYADYYELFYNRIKKYDPSGMVSNGGFHRPLSSDPRINPNYWKNWEDKINNIAANDGVNKPNSFYAYAAYPLIWREATKEKYGHYPHVDFWNIHPYPYNQENTPNAAVEAFSHTKLSVDHFREFMEYIGDSTKPLVVSEVSIFGRTPTGFAWICTSDAQCDSLQVVEQAYMDIVMPYMLDGSSGTPKVQKVLWYLGLNDPVFPFDAGALYTRPNGTDANGNTLYHPRTLAQNFINLKNSYKDDRAPIISRVNALSSGRSVSVVVDAYDPSDRVVPNSNFRTSG